MSGPSFRPVSSARSDDGGLINTILPSYHMFASTVSKRLVPNEESFKEDPPMYELSPLNTNGVTPMVSRAATPFPEQFEAYPFPQMEGQAEEDNEVSHQNSGDLWEITVLANCHKLKNLADSNNAMAHHLDVRVHFTAGVCQKGVQPDIIDISKTEYQQGDYLHGYVTIKNTYDKPIPFDMVYIVFEGVLCVLQSSNGPKDAANPPTVMKFLNMLDLFASWSYANIDRLVTDQGNPHDWCEGETDPYDGTLLSLDIKRLFQPNTTYKRFFSFRIPEKLLDDACEIHSLDEHCQLLPTLGRECNLDSAQRPPDFSELKVKDLGFMDSFIGYSVSARVIGRASQYNCQTENDQYVLVKAESTAVRVLPFTAQREYPEIYNPRVNACYKALVKSVEEKIAEGKRVLDSQRRAPSRVASSDSIFHALSPVSSASSMNLVNEKLRHLYLASGTNPKKNSSKQASDSEAYLHLSPYRKKTLTGYSKVLGVLSLSTPMTTYFTDYVPPLKFRNPLQGYNTKLRIPLELDYFQETADGSLSPPEPKSVSCELISLTIRSKKHYIPIEFNHEMCFMSQYVDDADGKKRDDVDNFESIVIKPFQEYYQSIVRLMKEIGFTNDAFKVETLLFKDLKSLATLQVKRINLAVPDVIVTTTNGGTVELHKSVANVPWEKSSSPVTNYNIYTKRMELDIDLNSCHLKGGSEVPVGKLAFDTICLVPEFQSCLLARLYYLRISVKQKGGLVQTVHVPLSVQHNA